ncbi:hypothetical protein FZI56_21475 [Cronobacter sakazakii]|nr:hypothetical protein FZI56_21475 [Cronobacter sakazakii]
MFKVEVVFHQRFNRPSVFGYVKDLPNFDIKTLTVYQDETLVSAVIVRTREVEHFKTIGVMSNAIQN